MSNYFNEVDLTLMSQPVEELIVDKETYLAWRKQWKTEYKKLSVLIREAKIKRKPKHCPEDYYWYQNYAMRGRIIARQMIEYLEDVKKRSWELKKRSNQEEMMVVA